MASVSFTSVTKRFGDVVAVDDVTLEIPDRESLVADGSDPNQSLTEADAAATAAIRDYNRRIGG